MTIPSGSEPADVPAVCHEDGSPAVDACVHCRLPTCDVDFEEREHLGLCRHCAAEIVAELKRGGALIAWPYPLRKTFD